MSCIDIHNQTEYDAHKDDKDVCLHIVEGTYTEIAGSARVGYVGGSASVDSVDGSARVGYVRGSARVGYVGGSARVGSVGDSARVDSVGDSARVDSVDGSARVDSVGDSARVDSVDGSASVDSVGGSASVGSVRGSARVGYVGDSASVDSVDGSARVDSVGGSARVGYVDDSARVGYVSGSARVGYVGDSARVDSVRGSARVGSVRGSARVDSVGGSASVDSVRDSASVGAAGCAVVHAHGGTVTAARFVTVYQHDDSAQITGGHVIQVPPIDTMDPATWAEYTGIHVEDEHLVVFKAVDADLVSGHGFSYPVGDEVAAPDFKPVQECGNGLHFSPHPLLAADYLHTPVKRFLACKVAIGDVVVLDASKIKARACRVLHEVDASGNQLADMRAELERGDAD